MIKKGFSLIEILLGISLFIIMSATAGAVLVNSLRSARKASATTLAKNEGQYALKTIQQAILFAADATCVSGTTLNYHVENDPTNTLHTYSLNGAAIRADGNPMTSTSVSIAQGSCTNVFTCSTNGSGFVTTVEICFVINNANGIDVSDTAGISGLKFDTLATLLNTKN